MIGICYHPTKVVLIDDNKNFLDSMMIQLGDKYSCSPYLDPKVALSFLKDEYALTPFHTRLASDDIKKVHHEIYNAQRFEEITVLVVDYCMPRMNGIDFLRKLKDVPMMRILLTGETGVELAVEAFNENLIDKFILKNTPDIAHVLENTIEELQKKQFSTASELFLNYSASSSKPILSILKDEDFAGFFTNLLKEKKITEYYLLDDKGSFLLFDENAHPSWLIAVSDDAMNTYQTLAEHGGASSSVIDGIKNRTHLLYFNDGETSQMPPVSEWDSHLYPAQILPSNMPHHYAYLTELKTNTIGWKKILPYHQFLDEHYSKLAF